MKISVSFAGMENKYPKLLISVGGIMSTLLVYGLLQERIMRVPYGEESSYFKYSLFLVLCNRVLTCSVAAIFLMANRKTMDPVAPLYKYGAVSVSNILTTTCQYEALKYVSFPIQTLAKSAKMIPVMVWGTLIMQKRYTGRDYGLALLDSADTTAYNRGKESTLWGICLMIGYLGFDGFTSTFQDKLFKGYNMEIYNQVFYTTLFSCAFSMVGLLVQGHLLPAIAFVSQHVDCFRDVILLSMVATASQFFISYTIRTFGALIFAIIMTTRQLVSILLSCIWFVHPLSWKQWIGAVAVFSALYSKSFFNARKRRMDLPKQQREDEQENSALLPTDEKPDQNSTLSVSVDLPSRQ
eukprot:TRINITY_DN12637_c0_g1_i1.p1 TRINITY_DN12637_c0_g1~~TRINITY_DN12637_c0_g1_i1.p1  ORF type:complete len:353 (+),score=38.24 TRINITY_DN12637_c0_g1_i1:335-1393(+)